MADPGEGRQGGSAVWWRPVVSISAGLAVGVAAGRAGFELLVAPGDLTVANPDLGHLAVRCAAVAALVAVGALTGLVPGRLRGWPLAACGVLIVVALEAAANVDGTASDSSLLVVAAAGAVALAGAVVAVVSDDTQLRPGLGGIVVGLALSLAVGRALSGSIAPALAVVVVALIAPSALTGPRLRPGGSASGGPRALLVAGVGTVATTLVVVATELGLAAEAGTLQARLRLSHMAAVAAGSLVAAGLVAMALALLGRALLGAAHTGWIMIAGGTGWLLFDIMRDLDSGAVSGDRAALLVPAGLVVGVLVGLWWIGRRRWQAAAGWGLLTLAACLVVASLVVAARPALAAVVAAGVGFVWTVGLADAVRTGPAFVLCGLAAAALAGALWQRAVTLLAGPPYMIGTGLQYAVAAAPGLWVGAFGLAVVLGRWRADRRANGGHGLARGAARLVEPGTASGQAPAGGAFSGVREHLQ